MYTLCVHTSTFSPSKLRWDHKWHTWENRPEDQVCQGRKWVLWHGFLYGYPPSPLCGFCGNGGVQALQCSPSHLGPLPVTLEQAQAFLPPCVLGIGNTLVPWVQQAGLGYRPRWTPYLLLNPPGFCLLDSHQLVRLWVNQLLPLNPGYLSFQTVQIKVWCDIVNYLCG